MPVLIVYHFTCLLLDEMFIGDRGVLLLTIQNTKNKTGKLGFFKDICMLTRRLCSYVKNAYCLHTLFTVSFIVLKEEFGKLL